MFKRNFFTEVMRSLKGLGSSASAWNRLIQRLSAQQTTAQARLLSVRVAMIFSAQFLQKRKRPLSTVQVTTEPAYALWQQRKDGNWIRRLEPGYLHTMMQTKKKKKNWNSWHFKRMKLWKCVNEHKIKKCICSIVLIVSFLLFIA